jgi:hypothetical protein
MVKKENGLFLALITLVLGLAVLACGTGYRTTSKSAGNSGEVRVRINDADGTDSTQVEIDEDYDHSRVSVTANLLVESGNCQATLLGEDGTIIRLNASPENPAEAYGDLMTDAFGEIELKTICKNAKNIDLTISYLWK